MFHSCASSPNNARVQRLKPQQGRMIVVKRKLTVGGLICYLASVSHYHKEFRAREGGCVFCCVSHMQFLFGI